MNDDGERILESPGAMQRAIGQLLDVGQIDRARQLAMDFIAANPSSTAGLLSLAQVQREAGHLEPALSTVEDAIALDPDEDQAHMQRAALLLRLGRYRESEDAIRTALAIDPTWGPSHALYAQILSVCDKDVEALQRAEHALSLMPDAPWLHSLRARLLLFVHPRHWNISEDAVRTALRLDPQDPQAHAILGMVMLRAGRNDEAEAAFREALRLDPGDALALRGLSELVKGKNPLYRPMLWFGQLMSRMGPDGQLGVLFGLWAIYAGARSVLAPVNPDAAELLTFVYLGFCAYTWFAEPITRALLRRAYPWLT